MKTYYEFTSELTRANIARRIKEEHINYSATQIFRKTTLSLPEVYFRDDVIELRQYYRSRYLAVTFNGVFMNDGSKILLTGAFSDEKENFYMVILILCVAAGLAGYWTAVQDYETIMFVILGVVLLYVFRNITIHQIKEEILGYLQSILDTNDYRKFKEVHEKI